MKIAGYMVTKNGFSGLIKTAIESLYNTTDVIYVSDGGSTDGTQEWLEMTPKVDKVITDTRNYNEKAHLIRERVINKLLKEENPDWIIGLDDDEFIIHPTKVRNAMKEKPINMMAFDFYHLWDEIHYRTDNTWNPNNLNRVITEKVTNQNEISISGHGNHCPRIPQCHDVVKGIKGAKMIHYGWRYKNDDLRVRKMEKKAERDKEPLDVQKRHYDSIYKEPELKKIPFAWRGMIVDKYKDNQKNALLK